MKKTLVVRTVTGFTAAVLPVLALVFLQTPLLGILVIFFAALAAYELCHAAQIKNKPMIIAAIVVGALVPPALEYHLLERLRIPVFPVLLGYFFLLVVLMLARFEQTRFSHVLYALLASLAVPGALASILLLRGHIELREGMLYEQNLAVFFVFFTLCCAWLTDVFALFVGVKFGRRKLCPRISPKKTVEGAVGGLALTALFNVGFAALFNAFWLERHKLSLLAIGLVSVLVCVVSMVGDLAASVLKRNYGIKDYGKLFPGHGGVMDRFDSVMFTMPSVFMVAYHIPIVSVM